MSHDKGKTRTRWQKVEANGRHGEPEPLVDTENRLMWALYHDPVQDRTQVEARNDAQADVYWAKYPDDWNISQSSLSRLLSRLDERVFTQEPPEVTYKRGYTSNFKHALHADDVLTGYNSLQDNRHGDVFLELYREALARFIADWRAIDSLQNAMHPPSQWARERYPDIDPNIGRKWGQATNWHDEDLHDPV